ncbi:MAG: response regulator transcription factor [Planctomycetales bacterium]|nr:response regulator transcription factor [Planctomycetales bacterium]
MKHDVPKIMLVEEDATLADITAFRLELLGYQVQQVHTAEAALEQVAQSQPDLLILDLFLPGIGGLELVGRLKSDSATAALPLLVFSVDADLNTVAKAHEAGADDYLVTPYDPAVLEGKIEKLLSRSHTAV